MSPSFPLYISLPELLIGALRNLPVVLINPMLISTAWNDFGARSPLLLGDFAQVYYICDEFLSMSDEKFCGVIQRASAGVDLYVLEGFQRGSVFPKNFTRVEFWPSGSIDEMDPSVLSRYRVEPDFVLRKLRQICSTTGEEILGVRP